MLLSTKEAHGVWSIREKISARCGRTHATREARRIINRHEHAGELKVPKSDEEDDVREQVLADRRARRGSAG